MPQLLFADLVPHKTIFNVIVAGLLLDHAQWQRNRCRCARGRFSCYYTALAPGESARWTHWRARGISKLYSGSHPNTRRWAQGERRATIPSAGVVKSAVSQRRGGALTLMAGTRCCGWRKKNERRARRQAQLTSEPSTPMTEFTRPTSSSAPRGRRDARLCVDVEGSELAVLKGMEKTLPRSAGLLIRGTALQLGLHGGADALCEQLGGYEVW